MLNYLNRESLYVFKNEQKTKVIYKCNVLKKDHKNREWRSERSPGIYLLRTLEEDNEIRWFVMIDWKIFTKKFHTI